MGDFGLVSIIMPSYNCEQFLEASIKSVISQTYRKWELLIVDDNSTDRSLEIIKNFNDKRIKYFVNDRNCGAALSRNKALREARGEWIAFLDSDDVWHPKKLELQLEFMKLYDYSFTYTDYCSIKDNKLKRFIFTAPDKLDKKRIRRYCYCFTSTVMYRTEVVGLLQIKDLKKNNDYAMWLLALENNLGYRLPECLTLYVDRDGSISSANKFKLIKWHYRLFRLGLEFSRFRSFLYTLRNLWFGFWKKIKYKTKISPQRFGELLDEFGLKQSI